MTGKHGGGSSLLYNDNVWQVNMEEVLKPVSVSYGFTTLIRVSAVLCYNNLLWIGTSQVCTLSLSLSSSLSLLLLPWPLLLIFALCVGCLIRDGDKRSLLVVMAHGYHWNWPGCQNKTDFGHWHPKIFPFSIVKVDSLGFQFWPFQTCGFDSCGVGK